MEFQSKPWGYESHLAKEDKYWVKILFIKPEQRISLQKHKSRNEVWTIISGTGVVTLDSEQLVVKKHDTVFVPEAVPHRIHNIDKKEELVILEVATGIPRDSDIFRIEDDYERK